MLGEIEGLIDGIDVLNRQREVREGVLLLVWVAFGVLAARAYKRGRINPDRHTGEELLLALYASACMSSVLRSCMPS
jgi:hypothetical protein